MRVLAGDRDRAPDVLRGIVAQILPSNGHPPAFRVKEPQQEVGDRGLARAARPKQRNALTRFETEAQVLKRSALPPRVTRPHVFERNRERPAGSGERGLGVADGCLLADRLKDPTPGRERRGQLAGGARQRRDRVKRRQRQQGKHRDQHAVEPAVGRRHDRHREHGRHREPGHHQAEALAHPGHQRIAASQLDQRAVGGGDAGESRALGAERDGLGSAAE